MKKYKVSWGYGDKIEIVEVRRETSAYVVTFSHKNKNGERREAKQSEFYSYYDTWEDAHNALIYQTQKKVQLYESILKLAKENLKKIEEMKNEQAI